MKSRAGSQILDIITSGMYNNPLMIVREYIQNATDSIDEAVERGIMNLRSGLIEVNIDGGERSITIQDNGIGVPISSSKEVLCSVAVSTKDGRHFRGFRGIGRLGGLGYCDQVTFETRAVGSAHVDKAIWNAKCLREVTQSAGKKDLISVIRRAVSFKRRKVVPSDSSHFFRIKMSNIHRFHSDDLMSVLSIREYVARTAPVPFDKAKFRYADEINHQLGGIDGYKWYNVFVNGEKIFKPHVDEFGISGQLLDEINGIEFVDFHTSEGDVIGKGWFAVTNLLASMPPRVRMRGIRIRQGNVEVGNEYYLAEQFSEQRFATWHIGEIHLDYSLKLNARRDGFENSLEYEAFLERVKLFAHHLSFMCRKASKKRSQIDTVKKGLSSVTSLISNTFFVGDSRRTEVIEITRNMLLKAEHVIQEADCSDALGPEVRRIKKKLRDFENDSISLESALEGRKLRFISPKTLLTEIFMHVVDCYEEHRTAESLIKEVIRPYIKNCTSSNSS